ncbi:MAG: O-methyltransferase [Eubacteriaceae bacterium]|nr:O-methyltransferase [Eubacteriaceae bacterium]
MDRNIEYIRSLIKENPDTLKLRKQEEENYIPIIRPEVMQFISVMIKIADIKKILEIGTAEGYSSICFCRAIGKDADITTIESEEQRVNTARKNIESFNLDKNVTVIHDDAVKALSYMTGHNVFDMIFLDGPKTHYLEMLPDCIRLLKEGGILLADNVLYFGMTSGEKEIPKKKRTSAYHLRDFLEAVSSSYELDTSIINFEDGLVISVKKGTK